MTDRESADKVVDSIQQQPFSISVFFPCYNEQESIEKTVTKAVEILERTKADYEVIIINDGSSDYTGQIADRIASHNNKIRTVHHPTNLGYGAALQSGFKTAVKNLVFYTDGDGQFDISEMPPLLEFIKEYDIVSCFRVNRQDNLVRKINGFCWTKLVCLLFRLKIRDIDCAFKLYKREIFDNIELSSSGALIDTEILARAVRKGYTITQKGVHHLPRTAGKQTGAKISVIFRAFKELFKLYRKMKNE
ncbi:MAG: glycosyltransferase family 2 protein [Planctomycetota bacterium]|jgi:glycosyltransferase involved in cell wall biosynthesis